MQYHQNGVRPGNPEIQPARTSEHVTDEVDVLIVGCGPAGLTLATQLSRFPEIRVKIIERKSGPLQFGQADGLACRSLEMFQAFGFAHKVMQEAYWVNEVTFWRPSQINEQIVRVNRIQDVEDDLSDMPHVILSQARVHDFYLEQMANSASRLVPEYNCELVELVRNNGGPFPVTAKVKNLTDAGKTETIRARYVVGCDGARSTVREQMCLKLEGSSARQLWGVMDVLAVTDFPDIRLKCAVQSAHHGSLLIIPREGGFLVRMYIELDELEEQERAVDRHVTAEALVSRAGQIMAPFSLAVKEISWWSAYEIGQRLCRQFDDSDKYDSPHVFIAGDACHTHSPKAGQGMNVSMADTFNLGWKLASVIRGKANPEILMTYSTERQAMAKELIDFDRDMARLFSKKPETLKEADQFERYFQKHGRYTAGVETRYQSSLICMPDTNQELAAGFGVGTRFHSAPVIRLADARRMELGQVLKADGQWRLILFAPAGIDGMKTTSEVAEQLLDDPEIVVPNLDVVAVFQEHHREIELTQVHEFYRPKVGRHNLIDYERIYCPDLKSGPDLFDLRKIDRQHGALIIVRPDQYVAGVLNPNTIVELRSFFAGIK